MKLMKRLRGFTLIELLIVIAIIAILAAIILVGLFSAQASARDTQAKSDIDSMNKALTVYYSDNNAYPTVTTALTWEPVYRHLNQTGNAGGINDTIASTSAVWGRACNDTTAPNTPGCVKITFDHMYSYLTDNTTPTKYVVASMLERNLNPSVQGTNGIYNNTAGTAGVFTIGGMTTIAAIGADVTYAINGKGTIFALWGPQ